MIQVTVQEKQQQPCFFNEKKHILVFLKLSRIIQTTMSAWLGTGPWYPSSTHLRGPGSVSFTRCEVSGGDVCSALHSPCLGLQKEGTITV